MKTNIDKRVKEICKEFDIRVKAVGVGNAGFELAVALAKAEAALQPPPPPEDLFNCVVCGYQNKGPICTHCGHVRNPRP